VKIRLLTKLVVNHLSDHILTKLSKPIKRIPLIPSRKFQSEKLITNENRIGIKVKSPNPIKQGRIKSHPVKASLCARLKSSFLLS
jgi:hypothetical protein